MGWLNVYGLFFMAVILIPNIVFALRCKDGFFIWLAYGRRIQCTYHR